MKSSGLQTKEIEFLSDLIKQTEIQYKQLVEPIKETMDYAGQFYKNIKKAIDAVTIPKDQISGMLNLLQTGLVPEIVRNEICNSPFNISEKFVLSNKTQKEKTNLTNDLSEIFEEKILDATVLTKNESKKKDKRIIFYLSYLNHFYINNDPEEFITISSPKRINLLKILKNKFIKSPLLIEICGYKNQRSLQSAVRDINISVIKMTKGKTKLITGYSRLGYRISKGLKISFNK